METLQLIVAFLGGGVLVGIFEWIRTRISEKETRKYDFLTDQIRNLYGPLYFLTAQNEGLFKLYDKFRGAYQKEYVEVEWSQDEDTQKNLKEGMDAFFKISNSYMDIVKENNDKLINIMAYNYTYIDPEDIEPFQQFVVDYNRMKNEMDRPDGLRVDLRIYYHIGEISYMRPKFIELIKERFEIKYQQLQEMQSVEPLFPNKVRQLLINAKESIQNK